MEKQLSLLKDDRDASTIWPGLPLQVRQEIEILFAEFINLIKKPGYILSSRITPSD